VFGEFAPVIGLDSSGGKRGYLENLPEEIIAVGGRVRGVGISEGKTGADISAVKI